MTKKLYPSHTKKAKQEYIARKAKEADPKQEKICTKCKESKPVEMFSKGEGPYGKRSSCKACQLKKNNAWRKKNPEKWRKLTVKHSKSDKTRDSYLKRKYGITLANYNKMLIEQNYVCKVCHNKNNINHRLYVDHHHESGVVRGLLCHKCNLIIGMCNEEPGRLLKIVEFIISKKKEIEDARANAVG